MVHTAVLWMENCRRVRSNLDLISFRTDNIGALVFFYYTGIKNFLSQISLHLQKVLLNLSNDLVYSMSE